MSDDGYEPLQVGQRIRVSDGRLGAVFWCFEDATGWRVFYILDDGTNGEDALSDIELSDEPVPDVVRCSRCREHIAMYEMPALLCERCFKEWVFRGHPN